MLVEFRVKNFRSFRDEQVLSLVASKDKSWLDTHTLPTQNKAAPFLLRSAVLYGANASGKSNLIRALQSMCEIIKTSTLLQPEHPFSFESFRLDSQYPDRPVEFEITFIKDGIRYQYGFAMTPHRIVSEHLLVYKTAKAQRWFARYFDPATGKDTYEFSAAFKGAKHLWEGATRPDSLFLSTAIQLNNQSMRPVYDWIKNELVVVNEQSHFSFLTSIQMLQQPDGHKKIRDFLASADTGIDNIEVVTEKTLQSEKILIDTRTNTTEIQTAERKVDKIRFWHATERGKAVFELTDESSGTRKLLFLAGPVMDILSKGLILVIDELDNSLHTLLVRKLVQLFHSPSINGMGAQLLFTTHDTSLLDAPGLFRRDQVWIVEKNTDQASMLIPLSDFSPRKNEALERGYLMGRYGGIPFLQHNLGMEQE